MLRLAGSIVALILLSTTPFVGSMTFAQDDCLPGARLLAESASRAEVACALLGSRQAAQGRAIGVVSNEEDLPGAAFTINFQFDSAGLTPASAELVDLIAEVIASEPALIGLAYVIDGHTDAVGPAADNLALGQRRGETVNSALVAAGLGSLNFKVRSFGETVLFDPDQPDAGVNRRVEITPVEN